MAKEGTTEDLSVKYFKCYMVNTCVFLFVFFVLIEFLNILKTCHLQSDNLKKLYNSISGQHDPVVHNVSKAIGTFN